MEGEESRSEATLHLTVQNLKNLKDTAFSPPCYVRNLPWRIEVMQRQTTSPGKQQRKSLGFFVQCNADSTSTTWSCYAKAELRLISQKPDTEPLVRKINHVFNSEENDWGYSHFMAWDDVLNPNKGFIKNNAITVEVHLSADMPHGVPIPVKPTGPVGDTENRAVDMNRNNVPEDEPVNTNAIEAETTSTEMTTPSDAPTAESNSQTQNIESTTAEPSQPNRHGVPMEVGAVNPASIITSTSRQEQNVEDDNPILNVLQRVEHILSSLLNITQQQNHAQTERDEYHYFALSVAAQLRKLPAHIAVDTQNKIQSTLSTARLTSMISNSPAAGSSSKLT